MDPVYLSTISALAGTIIGGVTSFATTWLTTTMQTKAARLGVEKTKREVLYGSFMDEVAQLYSRALENNGSVDYGKLNGAFALRGRIILLSSQAVYESADRALKFVVDIALGPPRTAAEMRKMMDDRKTQVIDEFAETCRQELQTLRLG
jgi:hypothetical protein